MRSTLLASLLCFAGLTLSGIAAPALGDDSPLARWTELVEQREAVNQKVLQLQKDFQDADADGKRQIQTEFQNLLKNFQQNIMPRMVEVAPAVYEADPQQYEAGEMVMQLAYRDNDYNRAAQIADRMLSAGHRSGAVLNVAGAAAFARHNFEKAGKLLHQAQDANQLDPRVGGPFLDSCEKYAAYWVQEQQIRAREAQAPEGRQLPRVEFITSRGKITVELFENEAPNTVANFISLVEGGTYNGTEFHRVIPNFMIQGGDPNSRDDDPSNDGQGGPGYTIACECYRDDARKHFRGSLSMAHAGKDTGGSQFFVTHMPTHWLNAETAEAGHTVFGRVIEGMPVVDEIEAGDELTSARVLRKRDHEYQPHTQPE